MWSWISEKEKAALPDVRERCFAIYSLVVCFFHLTFDVESCHLRYTVRADGDGLFEMAGELTLAVISHRDHTFLSRFDWCLGVGRNRATAAGQGLVDDQRLIADVGEGEGAFLYGLALGESSKVISNLVKLDLSLREGLSYATEQEHGEQ